VGGDLVPGGITKSLLDFVRKFAFVAWIKLNVCLILVELVMGGEERRSGLERTMDGRGRETRGWQALRTSPRGLGFLFLFRAVLYQVSPSRRNVV